MVKQVNGWRKASYSNGSGNCVEVAKDNELMVRDAKDRRGAVLRFSPKAWAAFTRSLKKLSDSQGADRLPKWEWSAPAILAW